MRMWRLLPFVFLSHLVLNVGCAASSGHTKHKHDPTVMAEIVRKIQKLERLLLSMTPEEKLMFYERAVKMFKIKRHPPAQVSTTDSKGRKVIPISAAAAKEYEKVYMETQEQGGLESLTQKTTVLPLSLIAADSSRHSSYQVTKFALELPNRIDDATNGYKRDVENATVRESDVLLNNSSQDWNGESFNIRNGDDSKTFELTNTSDTFEKRTEIFHSGQGHPDDSGTDNGNDTNGIHWNGSDITHDKMINLTINDGGTKREYNDSNAFNFGNITLSNSNATEWQNNQSLLGKSDEINPLNVNMYDIDTNVSRIANDSKISNSTNVEILNVDSNHKSFHENNTDYEQSLQQTTQEVNDTKETTKNLDNFYTVENNGTKKEKGDENSTIDDAKLSTNDTKYEINIFAKNRTNKSKINESEGYFSEDKYENAYDSQRIIQMLESSNGLNLTKDQFEWIGNIYNENETLAKSDLNAKSFGLTEHQLNDIAKEISENKPEMREMVVSVKRIRIKNIDNEGKEIKRENKTIDDDDEEFSVAENDNDDDDVSSEVTEESIDQVMTSTVATSISESDSELSNTFAQRKVKKETITTAQPKKTYLPSTEPSITISDSQLENLIAEAMSNQHEKIIFAQIEHDYESNVKSKTDPMETISSFELLNPFSQNKQSGNDLFDHSTDFSVDSTVTTVSGTGNTFDAHFGLLFGLSDSATVTEPNIFSSRLFDGKQQVSSDKLQKNKNDINVFSLSKTDAEKEIVELNEFVKDKQIEENEKERAEFLLRPIAKPTLPSSRMPNRDVLDKNENSVVLSDRIYQHLDFFEKEMGNKISKDNKTSMFMESEREKSSKSSKSIIQVSDFINKSEYKQDDDLDDSQEEIEISYKEDTSRALQVLQTESTNHQEDPAELAVEVLHLIDELETDAETSGSNAHAIESRVHKVPDSVYSSESKDTFDIERLQNDEKHNSYNIIVGKDKDLLHAKSTNERGDGENDGVHSETGLDEIDSDILDINYYETNDNYDFPLNFAESDIFSKIEMGIPERKRDGYFEDSDSIADDFKSVEKIKQNDILESNDFKDDDGEDSDVEGLDTELISNTKDSDVFKVNDEEDNYDENDDILSEKNERGDRKKNHNINDVEIETKNRHDISSDQHEKGRDSYGIRNSIDDMDENEETEERKQNDPNADETTHEVNMVDQKYVTDETEEDTSQQTRDDYIDTINDDNYPKDDGKEGSKNDDKTSNEVNGSFGEEKEVVETSYVDELSEGVKYIDDESEIKHHELFMKDGEEVEKERELPYDSHEKDDGTIKYNSRLDTNDSTEAKDGILKESSYEYEDYNLNESGEYEETSNSSVSTSLEVNNDLSKESNEQNQNLTFALEDSSIETKEENDNSPSKSDEVESAEKLDSNIFSNENENSSSNSVEMGSEEKYDSDSDSFEDGTDISNSTESNEGINSLESFDDSNSTESSEIMDESREGNSLESEIVDSEEEGSNSTESDESENSLESYEGSMENSNSTESSEEKFGNSDESYNDSSEDSNSTESSEEKFGSSDGSYDNSLEDSNSNSTESSESNEWYDDSWEDSNSTESSEEKFGSSDESYDNSLEDSNSNSTESSESNELYDDSWEDSNSTGSSEETYIDNSQENSASDEMSDEFDSSIEESDESSNSTESNESNSDEIIEEEPIIYVEAKRGNTSGIRNYPIPRMLEYKHPPLLKPYPTPPLPVVPRLIDIPKVNIPSPPPPLLPTILPSTTTQTPSPPPSATIPLNPTPKPTSKRLFLSFTTPRTTSTSSEPPTFTTVQTTPAPTLPTITNPPRSPPPTTNPPPSLPPPTQITRYEIQNIIKVLKVIVKMKTVHHFHFIDRVHTVYRDRTTTPKPPSSYDKRTPIPPTFSSYDKRSYDKRQKEDNSYDKKSNGYDKRPYNFVTPDSYDKKPFRKSSYDRVDRDSVRKAYIDTLSDSYDKRRREHSYEIRDENARGLMRLRKSNANREVHGYDKRLPGYDSEINDRHTPNRLREVISRNSRHRTSLEGNENSIYTKRPYLETDYERSRRPYNIPKYTRKPYVDRDYEYLHRRDDRNSHRPHQNSLYTQKPNYDDGRESIETYRRNREYEIPMSSYAKRLKHYTDHDASYDRRDSVNRYEALLKQGTSYLHKRNLRHSDSSRYENEISHEKDKIFNEKDKSVFDELLRYKSKSSRTVPKGTNLSNGDPEAMYRNTYLSSYGKKKKRELNIDYIKDKLQTLLGKKVKDSEIRHLFESHLKRKGMQPDFH